MFKKSYLWLLIAAVLLLTIQILAIVIYIYSFIPLVWSDVFLKGLEPTRDTLFYAVFLASGTTLTVLGMIWIFPQLNSEENRRKFKLWLYLESVWCFLVFFCFFKWSTYRYPFWNVLPYENSAWLQPFFCAVCGLSLLSKIFFPEIEMVFRRWQALGPVVSMPRRYLLALQILFVAGVALLLYIPRPQDVTALALVWDQWRHLDSVAGWFVKHGWFLSYEQTVQVLVFLAITYIIGLFYFIRLWLKSWLLAAIGSLLVIKFGMFYYGTAPCVWIDPANTFLAHGWDIFLFFGLWFVSSQYPQRFYPTAAVMGLALVFFWYRSNGYIDLLGLDNQPMMAPLRVRQFFPFFMGFFVPIFYVFNLIIMIGQKGPKNVLDFRLPLVLSIYGLLIFVDYIEHPMIGHYGSLMVPAILLLLWRLQQVFRFSDQFVKQGGYFGILVLLLGALLTNRLMLTYPNFIFQDKERFARERAYEEHFDVITPSALMVRQLTDERQKAVLLSNFETAILMQAHRQPLFDDFPVMFSSFSNSPGGLKLITKKQCLRLVNNLAEENALYVFVDGRLLALAPQAINNSSLKVVLDFLKEHYTVYGHQGFLVALQRK